MEYKKFVEYIKKNTEYIAGEGGNVTINHVIKNNGCEMDGNYGKGEGYCTDYIS